MNPGDQFVHYKGNPLAIIERFRNPRAQIRGEKAMMGMHTMEPLQEPEKGWSVGYWLCDPTERRHWHELCQFAKDTDALNRVNILNGGPGLA